MSQDIHSNYSYTLATYHIYHASSAMKLQYGEDTKARWAKLHNFFSTADAIILWENHVTSVDHDTVHYVCTFSELNATEICNGDGFADTNN